MYLYISYGLIWICAPHFLCPSFLITFNEHVQTWKSGRYKSKENFANPLSLMTVISSFIELSSFWPNHISWSIRTAWAVLYQKRAAELFKHSAELKAFCKGFKNLVECLKDSATSLKINARLSLLVKGHVQNFWQSDL